MKPLWITGLTIALGGTGLAGADASQQMQLAQARVLADTVKPGQWEFTSQLQMPGMPHLPPGVPSRPNVQMPQGGMASTYRACVDSDRAVPSDPRGGCKVEHVQRNGGTVSWTGTCTTAQGTVRSEGVAHYSGDTMQADLTTQVPGANGQTLKTTQRITGRYVGACAR